MNPMYVSAGAAVVAAVCCVLTYIRTSQWRKQDGSAALKAEMTALDHRVTKVEIAQQNLATKEDVARLEGSIGTVEALIEQTQKGVDRIESFAMTGKLTGAVR